MEEPMSQAGRFAIKGYLSGTLNHVDAFSEQAPAVDTAEAVYGYDRVFVVDTHKGGAIVWDSADKPEAGTNG